MVLFASSISKAMEHGRLGKPEPADPDQLPQRKRGWSLERLLFVIAIILFAAAGAAVLAAIVMRNGAVSYGHRRPTQAMSRVCGMTQYPTLCVNSLLDFPGAIAASDQDLVTISVNMTLQRVGSALNSVSEMSYLEMDSIVRSAHTDCLELLDDSVDLLYQSLSSTDGASTEDVLTWLSAALTNQDTCGEGIQELKGHVKNRMSKRLENLWELISNSLAIYSARTGGFSTIPIQNRRRRLLGDRFPAWISRKERMLLQIPASQINADVIVSRDGNGTCKTIGEAIKLAPDNSKRRFIIYVRAGWYEEGTLKIGRKKTNIMVMGDGKGKTVISGGKSVQDGITTFRTASFAASGAGFIARDLSFVNWAGPEKHQAVALRVSADHAVVYRCSIEGYQDTLYAHSQRQFYRECNIYGTVDFIFGNAAAVFQKCNLFVRYSPTQINTITAQSRSDPNQNTGIVVQDCTVRPVNNLAVINTAVNDITYLGRPWRPYALTVFMETYLGSLINPAGWLAWGAGSSTSPLYYAEYLNNGPGSSTSKRIHWTGYHVITSPQVAAQFTPDSFFDAGEWIPATGVPFQPGL
ncbi:pectinesterase [Genlisea aurea]|uniref:Pectinesterase n=1 Tax=Genlisea aurea TaxID=192259 RepID=S8ELC4_9LAMI|nr:pectinesterase [Genlisea aurea]